MISWNEISNICERIEFPNEAIATLEKVYATTMQTFEKEIQTLSSQWLDPEADWKQCLADLSVIAEKTGVSINVLQLVFFLYSAIPLRKEYEKRNLPEELYWETLQDLRYKMIECYNLYGEWGIFVPIWYRCFYICERFSLGRLQYEKIPFPLDNYNNIVKKDDIVLACHIPSSGALLENDVIESLKSAYNFYKSYTVDGILTIVCHSWLLYEPFEEVFTDSPNVQKFRKLFNIIGNEKDETNRDFWRIFNKNFSKETLLEVSPKTKLQNRLHKYLLEGNCMGCGLGIIRFDGAKIINKP